MKATVLRTLFAACTLYSCVSVASAAPVVNQIVPVAVYQNQPGAFGLAYDSVNNVVWVSSINGGSRYSVNPFNSFTAALIASFPVGANGSIVSAAAYTTGLTTPNVFGQGAQALGFFGGQIVEHRGGALPIGSYDPITGANVNGNFFSPLPPGTSFLDGLDVDAAGNVFYSPEPAATGGDAYLNAAIFLNNSNAAQTQDGAALNIVRWSGIELAAGSLFAVADSIGTSGRTIARYDPVTGALLGYDPDGSPFAIRLEDLAFDGRYLYGSDFGTNQIFVFDIIGPGGLAPVPEPASLALWSILGLTGGIGAWRRRKAKIAG